MKTDDVWRLVERARREAGGSADAVASRVSALLAERPPAEIVAFAQPFWDLMAMSYRADLWAAAYLINGGASDDGFDYFRGWLIAQGQGPFEQALADPDSLAGMPEVVQTARAELECEDILDVAWNAHKTATGQQLPSSAFSIEYPKLDPDWDFDFDDVAQMRRRLPRLSALFLS